MPPISAFLGLVIGSLGIWIVGAMLLRVLRPAPADLSRRERLVLAFGLGNGAVVLEMFAFIVGNVPLMRWSLGIPWIVLGGAILYGCWRQGRFRRLRELFDLVSARPTAWYARARNSLGWLEGCVGVAVTLAVVDLLVRVLTSPFLYGDAIWFWTPKAKILYEHRLVPLTGFRDLGEFFHADYPLFVPLTEAWLFIWMGQTNEYVMKLLFPLYAVFLILGLWAFAARLCGRRAGMIAAGLLATTPIVLWQGTAGMADLPLAFYFLLATAMLLRWFAAVQRPFLVLSAVFVGLTGWIKNEGLSFIVLTGCVVAAHLGTRRESGTVGRAREALLFGGIAAGVVVPSLVMRYALGVESDLGVPAVASLLPLARERLWPITTALAGELFSPSRVARTWNVAWYLLTGVVIVHGRALWRSLLRYPALLIVGQIAVYLGVYIITPHDLGWHVGTSLDRLLLHLYPLALLLIGWGIAKSSGESAAADGRVRDPRTRNP